jgi:surface polysaccharide O-acyltransferase-like enzyme
VLAHSTDTVATRTGPSSLTVALSTGIRFAVPAFFMISGFLMGAHHRDPAYRLDVRRLWSRRALTLTVPFVWNLICMLIFVVAAGGSALDSNTLFNVTTGYIHLYFVAVPIAAHWFSARLLKVCLVLAAVSSVAFYAFSEYLLWTQPPDGHQFEWRFGKLGLAWAVFFFWGLWLGYRPQIMEWLRRHRWWLVAASQRRRPSSSVATDRWCRSCSTSCPVSATARPSFAASRTTSSTI